MNQDKAISIKVDTKQSLPLDEMKVFQGDLKSVTVEKMNDLKASIIEHGIDICFHIWKDDKGVNQLIDGTHRFYALNALRDQGYFIPPLPVVYVQAKNRKEAAKIILIANSRYARMSEESVGEFMSNFDLSIPDLENLDLIDVDMDYFGQEDEYSEDDGGASDAIPENVEHKAMLGDLFELGDHRLLCGDSTDIEQVERLMNGEKADMVFTDPPYGDNHAGMDVDLSQSKKGKSIVKKIHLLKSDKNLDFLTPSLKCASIVCKEKATKMVFFKWNKWTEVIDAAECFGEPSSCCVWDREEMAAATFRFNPVHEFCFHWGSLADKHSKSNLTNVWRAKKERENKKLHPTVKPMAILTPAIEVCTESEALVFDPFGGSGSTLIACEKTNRKCFMMELDPHYVDVICKRFQAFSGKTAYRLNDDGSKTPWDDIPVTEAQTS